MSKREGNQNGRDYRSPLAFTAVWCGYKEPDPLTATDQDEVACCVAVTTSLFRLISSEQFSFVYITKALHGGVRPTFIPSSKLNIFLIHRMEVFILAV